MAKIKLDIVTAERVVLSEEVDAVVVPGVEGQLGILPHHAPLMTMIKPGLLVARKDGEDMNLAVSGGFLEVRPDHVILLADTAERAEEIDVARAEAAVKRAQELMKERVPTEELAKAEASLRRALARIETAKRSRKKPNKGL